MMQVRTILETREAVRSARQMGKSIGLVPTMGALHAGHASLIEAAKRDEHFVVVSIFVNPTQFAPSEDLSKYPRPLDADLALCERLGADLVFHPHVEEIYSPKSRTFVVTEELAGILEGKVRPAHFRGVTTIVMKLFQITLPDVAYFGQKDFQQQLIIRRMVLDLDVPVKIVVCPIVRESDGLAMSSRNVYLSPSDRHHALALSRSLEHARSLIQQGERNYHLVEELMNQELARNPAVLPDYAVIRDPETLACPDMGSSEVVALVAARLGTTRLIDNLLISIPK